MKRVRFCIEQKVRILEELRGGKSPKKICAEHNISSQTVSLWKRKHGEKEVNEAWKLQVLKDENALMTRIIADQAMQISTS